MRQLLIHGMGQDASAWDKTLAGLTGTGPTACPSLTDLAAGQEYTYDTIYRAFSAHCLEEPEPMKLCGLSLGAVIALQFAIEHPQKVSSLILIAPQFKMPKALLRVQNIIFSFLPNSMFEKMGLKKRDLIALTTSMMDLDFSQRLREISCPVLVLCGERDRTNRAACEKTALLIPGARLQVIPDAGHEVNLDAPQALSAAVSAFFNGSQW